ncbi:hypothetical protein [Mycoplasma todarodis]|uniref:SHOCT domain-containing protein n=1 Tax=Mycoplasma todarodis TaxID=1937191 RepID=A0A4R0XVB9_9MOLU|nr:hypothetical protein [Mycoplasma todarodis]TCG11679.1 hypothetical protein C4B25_01040 [Mycoplasma todarodis]
MTTVKKAPKPFLGLRISTMIFGILTFIMLFMIAIIVFTTSSQTTENFKNWAVNVGFQNSSFTQDLRDVFENGTAFFTVSSSYTIGDPEMQVVTFALACISTIFALVFMSLSITCVVKMRSISAILGIVIAVLGFLLSMSIVILIPSEIMLDPRHFMVQQGKMRSFGWRYNWEDFSDFIQKKPSALNGMISTFSNDSIITTESFVIDSLLASFGLVIGVLAVLTSTLTLIKGKPRKVLETVQNSEATKVRTTPNKSTKVKKTKNTIFILSVITMVITMIAIILFGESNWVTTKSTFSRHSYMIDKTIDDSNMIAASAGLFALAFIMTLTTWIIQVKSFKKISRTKLSVFGVTLYTVSLFIIIIPMLIINISLAMEVDLEWVKRSARDGMSWGNSVDLTEPYGAISAIYTYGVVLVSLLLICQFVFVILMGVDAYGNTSISKEIKSGGLITGGISEYKKELHHIFRLQISGLFCGVAILCIAIFMPIWIILFGVTTSDGGSMVISIVMVMLMIIELLVVVVVSWVIAIKVIIKALKLESREGFVPSIHGSRYSTIKIIAILSIFIQIAGLVLLILIHKELKDEEYRLETAETPKIAEANKITNEQNNSTLEEKLKKLKDLKESNIISEKEYAEMRKNLIEKEL